MKRSKQAKAKQIKRHRQAVERAVHGVFLGLGLVTVVCVLLITLYLVASGLPVIGEIGLTEFLFDREWAPTSAAPRYGILPFILTSVYGTAGAILLGVPVDFFSAVYLAKAAPARVREVIEPAISLLAGIPSVVYGLVGMLVLIPGIRRIFHVPDGSSLLAAILVLAVMILPSIVKMSMMALESVPREYEDASLALGATPIETYFRVSVPAARSGIAAAVVLGVGRAIGEAMAVVMMSGNVANNALSAPERAVPHHGCVQRDVLRRGGAAEDPLFSIALVLFLFIMLINAVLNFSSSAVRRGEDGSTRAVKAEKSLYRRDAVPDAAVGGPAVHGGLRPCAVPQHHPGPAERGGHPDRGPLQLRQG